ncbi:YehR family lipoprotein [Kosakonia sp. H02]|nr:YehR family lipoprotein [Kosakonia sp. H02]
MKFSKLIAALFSVALLVGLVGCGEKEQSKTFTWSQAGTEVTLTYYYNKDDKVLRQTAKNKIEYSSIGAKNKEEAMKVLDPISKRYQSIKGIKESVDYEETYAQETLDVDYSEVDFAQLNNLQGSEFTGTVNGNISMSRSEELLKARGFKEVQ